MRRLRPPEHVYVVEGTADFPDSKARWQTVGTRFYRSRQTAETSRAFDRALEQLGCARAVRFDRTPRGTK